MSRYALAVVPLIHDLKSNILEFDQVWFTDDATGAGTCASLRAWWDHLLAGDPKYGYYPMHQKPLC